MPENAENTVVAAELADVVKDDPYTGWPSPRPRSRCCAHCASSTAR